MRPLNHRQEIIIDTSECELSPPSSEVLRKRLRLKDRYLHSSTQLFSNDVVRFGYLLVACVHLFSLVSEDHCDFR